MANINDKLKTLTPEQANSLAEQLNAGYLGNDGRAGQPCPIDDSLKLHDAEIRDWCSRGCSVSCPELLCEYLKAREEVRKALEALGYKLTGVNVYEISHHRYTAWHGKTCLGVYDTDRKTFVD